MIGQRLKLLREKRDMTQQELATVLETTQAQIWRWENDGAAPNTETIIRIAKYFDVTTDYLLGLVNDPRRELLESDLSEDERQLIRHFRARTFLKLFQFITKQSEKDE